MQSDAVKGLAKEIKKVGVLAEEADVVALYALVVGLEGVTVLDGTTREVRMKGDLEGLEEVGRWAEGEGKQRWEECLRRFRGLIGEV